MATHNDAPSADVQQSITPSYRKVRDWLVQQIAAGKLDSGAKIPSERTLAEVVGLSRPSVTRAIARLTQEGMVVTEPRVGTFVKVAPIQDTRPRGQKTVAVVMPWLNDAIIHPAGKIPFPSEMRRAFTYGGRYVPGFMAVQVAQGVFAELAKSDARIITRANGRPESEAAILEDVIRERPDGMIALPSHATAGAQCYARLIASGIPIVFVDHYFGESADRVVADNFGGAREATRHLVSLGHRRIAHFTDFAGISSVADREAGYRAALQEAGIPIDESIVRAYEITRGAMRSYDLALSCCRDRDDPITAVFCLNEDVLLATLQAAAKMGLSVPDDLEIAGFFDEHVHDAIAMPFTRAVQRKTEMGATAARLLLDRLSGNAPNEPRHMMLPVDLIPRGVAEFQVRNRETYSTQA